MVGFLRGNLIVNPPEIVNEYLQKGGQSAFRRGCSWPGPCFHSYGCTRRRTSLGPEVSGDIQRLNAVRQDQPALQRATNLTFRP